jgi:hypothetical protein
LRNEVGHAISNGLEWLKANQDPDGSWDDSRYPDKTASAVKAFMGSPDAGDHVAPCVGKGYAFLQGLAHADGSIQGTDNPANIDTALCAEAFVAAANPKYDPLLRKELAFLLQHPPRAAMWEIEYWLEAVYNLRGFADAGNRPDFAPVLDLIQRRLPKPLERLPLPAMYELLLSYRFAGLKPDDPRVRLALDTLDKHYLAKGDSEMAARGFYFFSEMTAGMLTAYGMDQLQLADGTKADWAADMAKRLIDLQLADGSWSYGSGRYIDQGKDASLVSSNILALEIIYLAL